MVEHTELVCRSLVSGKMLSPPVVGGDPTGSTRALDIAKVISKEVALLSKKTGALAATTMGDNEIIVDLTVREAGTDNATVKAPLDGKEEKACVSLDPGLAVTAGDGTNDVFVSIRVDIGTVTGVGMDAVTEVVDAASTKSDFNDTLCVAMSLRKAARNTKENSPRVPTHNTTGTFAVVGTPHFVPGTVPNFTTVVVVTSSLSPRAAINVSRSNSASTDKLATKKLKKGETDTSTPKNEKKLHAETEGTTREYREVYAIEVPVKTGPIAKVDYNVKKVHT